MSSIMDEFKRSAYRDFGVTDEYYAKLYNNRNDKDEDDSTIDIERDAKRRRRRRIALINKNRSK